MKMNKTITLLLIALVFISGCYSNYKDCNQENYGFLTNATMENSLWYRDLDRCCFDFNKYSGFNKIDCIKLIPK